MKKMFLRISLMACIGLVFTVGYLLASFGMPLRNFDAKAESSGSRTVAITSNVPLLNDQSIRIRIVRPNNALPTEHFGEHKGENALDVAVGTVISIVGRSDRFLAFDAFAYPGGLDFPAGAPGAIPLPNGGTRTSELRFRVTAGTSPINIEVKFAERIVDFALSISGRTGGIDFDPEGNTIGGGLVKELGDSVDVTINGNTETYDEDHAFEFKPLQELNSITFNGIPGYRFDDMSIKLRFPDGNVRYQRFSPAIDDQGNERIDDNNPPKVTYHFDQVFDAAFFDQYLSLNAEIIVVIELTKLHTLRIEFPSEATEAMVEDIAVYRISPDEDIDDPSAGVLIDDLATDNFFESGYGFRIEVTPKAHHEFLGFDVPHPDAQDDLTEARRMHDSMSVTLHLRQKTYTMNSTYRGNEFLAMTSSGTSKFRVGDEVWFALDEVPSNNSISSWKIRRPDGRTINVPVSANGIRVELTDDMLNAQGVFELVHLISYSPNMGLILGLGIPGSIIGILLVIFLIFFMQNNKRKKVIKAQLTERRQEKIKRDVGGYISDLRSGADTGQITKEQVKQEMKKQKEDKSKDKGKEKPQVVQKAAPAAAPVAAPKPAPAPAPAPKEKAAPAAPEVSLPAITPKLSGAKLLPDRRIVDASQKVIATMNTDGSIADASGKMFAKIRMSDGAIVGLDNKVIGVVQGDGTIK